MGQQHISNQIFPAQRAPHTTLFLQREQMAELQPWEREVVMAYDELCRATLSTWRAVEIEFTLPSRQYDAAFEWHLSASKWLIENGASYTSTVYDTINEDPMDSFVLWVGDNYVHIFKQTI